ncbi:hypothetical protein [Chlorobium sp.]|jgi:hypothetical protein|uniref:hypothetical protein n=1 Tax=Chlorobium sp. TaxID=1095 RepID=UPI002F41E12A|nr:hypothetical protein [Chlorobiota bacterium]
MGKRQIIYRSAEIGGNQSLVNREVNLVTREQRVWHGVVTSVGSSEIELRDARKGRHTFIISEIDRIFDEVKTDY